MNKLVKYFIGKILQNKYNKLGYEACVPIIPATGFFYLSLYNPTLIDNNIAATGITPKKNIVLIIAEYFLKVQ